MTGANRVFRGQKKSPPNHFFSRKKSPPNQFFSKKKSPPNPFFSKKNAPPNQFFSRNKSLPNQFFSKKKSLPNQIFSSKKYLPHHQELEHNNFIHSKKSMPHHSYRSKNYLPHQYSHKSSEMLQIACWSILGLIFLRDGVSLILQCPWRHSRMFTLLKYHPQSSPGTTDVLILVTFFFLHQLYMYFCVLNILSGSFPNFPNFLAHFRKFKVTTKWISLSLK